MKVLVTGGAGYIGSHAVVELLQAGHDVEVVDSLVNSKAEAMQRVRQLTGRDVPLHVVDLRHAEALDAAFRHCFDGTPPDSRAVLHFAGLKAVGESVLQPLRYYECNVGGTICLLHAMQRHRVANLVFSSSATVYGDSGEPPFAETSATAPANAYGRSKLVIEHIIEDLGRAWPEFSAALLRYFNPVGAHPSGRIGEDPGSIPGNLMPFITQVAVGRRPELVIFGNDWPTADGTGVRDYLHVVDLARGHAAALDWSCRQTGVRTFNLGSGRGHSVLQMIEAFEKTCRVTVPYRIGPRRDGDIACSFADVSRANEELHWQAQLSVDDMCRDAWRWQSGNPHGYPPH